MWRKVPVLTELALGLFDKANYEKLEGLHNIDQLIIKLSTFIHFVPDVLNLRLDSVQVNVQFILKCQIHRIKANSSILLPGSYSHQEVALDQQVAQSQ